MPSSKTARGRERCLTLPFVLFRLSMGWMRPERIGESSSFHSATDSNVHFIQKHSHRHPENNV